NFLLASHRRFLPACFALAQGESPGRIALYRSPSTFYLQGKFLHPTQAMTMQAPRFAVNPRILTVLLISSFFIFIQAELPPLIPREVLFGNPERTSPHLSPDGKRAAWLAPDKRNVLQVWVRTIGTHDDNMVTADTK